MGVSSLASWRECSRILLSLIQQWTSSRSSYRPAQSVLLSLHIVKCTLLRNIKIIFVHLQTVSLFHHFLSLFSSCSFIYFPSYSLLSSLFLLLLLNSTVGLSPSPSPSPSPYPSPSPSFPPPFSLSPPSSSSSVDGTGWSRFECACLDNGLLADTVYHSALCGSTCGSESLRGVPTVLSQTVQWKTTHSTDTYGDTSKNTA